MSRPRIVVPGDDPPWIQGSPELARLAELGEVVVHETRPADLAEQIERAKGARVLVNTRGIVTWPRAALAALPELQFITTCSIGTDSVDLVAAKELGIAVANVPGETVPIVAEHLFALMLGAAKRLGAQTLQMKQGVWETGQNVLLRGKTLGVVGTGAIGSEMARLAKAIGMEVIAWTFNPSAARAAVLGVTFVSLEDLLQRADVVSLNVKLTDASRGLIGAREIGLMKPGAILVNGARGAVVDMAALVAALESGKLHGAGLDVFPEEPLPADAAILGCREVVLTPHAGDAAPEARTRVNRAAVDNVIAFLEGRPQNLVTG